MKLNLISIAAASLLAVLSLGAQAATTVYPDGFNAAPFSLGGTATQVAGNGDPFVRLAAANDTLTYSFTLASVSDVILSFLYTGGTRSEVVVSWTGPLNSSVAFATGSSAGTLNGAAGNNANPGVGSDMASYLGDNLAAGSYSFVLKSTGTGTGTGVNARFNIDDFSASVTPVPEPETYAMMLAGLGAIGFLSRRRKARQV